MRLYLLLLVVLGALRGGKKHKRTVLFDPLYDAPNRAGLTGISPKDRVREHAMSQAARKAALTSPVKPSNAGKQRHPWGGSLLVTFLQLLGEK